jgi:diguanylate cyclase (GGDEF)-like protein
MENIELKYPGPDFQAVFDAWPSPAATLDRAMTITACNAAFEAATQRPRALFQGRRWREVFRGSEQQASALARSFRRVLRTGKPHYLPDFRSGSFNAGGQQPGRTWAVSNIPLMSETGKVVGILHCPIDVSSVARKSTKARTSRAASNSHNGSVPALRDMQVILDVERRRLQQLFQQAPGFICVLEGPQHVFELANDAYYQLVGHRDIIGRAVAEVLPEVVTQGYMEKLDRVYRTGEVFIGRAMPLEVQCVAGAKRELKYIDLIYQPIFDACRNVTGIFVQGSDVTEAYTLAQEIAFQAAHDSLTGLFNRREFSRLTEHIQGSGPHALLYMDLDHFKIVNDRCGHAAGDSLLREVAAALSARAGEDAILARLGGDEFALLRPNCIADAAVALAQELRAAIRAIDFVWRGRRYGVTLSVGVANFHEPDVSFETALGLADAACFLAKERGRDRVKLALPSDEDVWTQLSDMDNVTRLKEAIRDDRIVLYGQRIYSLNYGDNETTRSFEILSRLSDLDGTLIPPSGFIPAAERFGLIEELDRHIIAKAFAHLAGLDSKIRKSVCYFLNLSGVTLSSASFSGFIEKLLAAHPDVLASQICFEVTETAALSDTRRSADAMRRLSGYGFRFALDDFGSGMASFSYLQQLPVKYVKIDGDFIKDVLTNPANAIIVEAVAKLARCMNIQAVAECIESCELLPVLRSLGIQYGQGFALQAPEDLDTAVTGARPGQRVLHKTVRPESGGMVLDLRKRTRRPRVLSASAGHLTPQDAG